MDRLIEIIHYNHREEQHIKFDGYAEWKEDFAKQLSKEYLNKEKALKQMRLMLNDMPEGVAKRHHTRKLEELKGEETMIDKKQAEIYQKDLSDQMEQKEMVMKDKRLIEIIEEYCCEGPRANKRLEEEISKEYIHKDKVKGLVEALEGISDTIEMNSLDETEGYYRLINDTEIFNSMRVIKQALEEYNK